MNIIKGLNNRYIIEVGQVNKEQLNGVYLARTRVFDSLYVNYFGKVLAVPEINKNQRTGSLNLKYGIDVFAYNGHLFAGDEPPNGVPYVCGPDAEEVVNWETYQDVYKPDIEVGDTVYFCYQEISDNACIDPKKGIFAINYNEIVCVVRDGEIITQSNYLLANKIIDKAKFTVTGILIDLQDTERLHVVTVSHCNPRSGLKPGDQILVQDNYDWSFIVDGVEYYALRYNQILGNV
jgi:co-chaperonin GroES (HSP10)